MPKIYDSARVDEILEVSQQQAEDMTRLLAKKEGVFCGVSSGGATHVALELSKRLENATIVVVICDRGDRYISTGIFPD